MICDETFDIEALPRLLYVGDLSVETLPGSPAVLYRLLENYPKHKLMIVEGQHVSRPELRIAGVEYHELRSIWSRLLMSRFHSWASTAATLCSEMYGRRLIQLMRDFRPQAILTLAWEYKWATAAALARNAGIPFHLIVHDDWPNLEYRTGLERQLLERHLRYWYPRAASRLCVSPYTAEEYRRRYGATADVLWPSRSGKDPEFAEPAPTLAGPCEPFTVAFAGSIWWGFASVLQRMAMALRRINGRLLIYGPGPPPNEYSLLQEPNIEIRGLVSSSELIQRCREEAHAMFMVMSHHELHRPIAEISFPSKLADLTAVGLPLVMDGPEYWSAIRWARETQGVAEVITNGSVDGLAEALVRLKDPGHRIELARVAIQKGKECFSRERAVSTLYGKLIAGLPHQRTNYVRPLSA